MRLLRALSLLACALALAACGTHTFRGTPLDPPAAAPGLDLADQDGRPFRLEDRRGDVVVLFFGYTSCPDVCPTQLAELAAARRNLGAAAGLTVAMVTVDPERDTPAALAAYMRGFDPSFIGLTGSEEQLQAAYAAYGVYAGPHHHDGQAAEAPAASPKDIVEHSGYVYAIDRAGRWRVVFSPEASVDDLTADLGFLLSERP